MKVLVTGATGFIGHYVIHELLQRNVQVIASSTSVAKAQHMDWFPHVTFVAHTLGNNEPRLMEHFHTPDALIHLAWQGLPNYKQLFHFEEVLPQQYAFLKQLIAEGLQDITITGTCFEYGKQEGALSESMAAMPGNPYSLSKYTLYCFLTELQKHIPFALKWVRLFYMYGKGQSPSSILSQLDKALEQGDTVFNMSMGDQLRDYLPVEKMAQNIVDIALQRKVTGIVNSCSGNPISIKALVENHLKQREAHIALNLGYYPYPDYEPKDFWGDTTKLHEITAE